jgi:hypothetical protein
VTPASVLSLAVAAARILGAEAWEPILLEALNRLPDRSPFEAEHVDADRLKSHQGPAADSADDCCIDRLAGDDPDGITGTMLVIIVRVIDPLNIHGLAIHDQEARSRTKVTIGDTVQAKISSYRYTDPHCSSTTFSL